MNLCLEREAVVTETRGNWARIHADRQTVCGACKARGACGAQLLDRHRGQTGLWVKNGIGAREGESVLVTIPTGTLLG
ncbi:MAG: SoxR reducing system RseC family protein, partial [Halomonas sp.]